MSIESLSSAASLPPNEQRLIAIALTAAGANARALRWLDRALARSPDDPACLANRGKLRIATGEFDAGRHEYALMALGFLFGKVVTVDDVEQAWTGEAIDVA